jgi:hypothetical protein
MTTTETQWIGIKGRGLMGKLLSERADELEVEFEEIDPATGALVHWSRWVLRTKVEWL